MDSLVEVCVSTPEVLNRICVVISDSDTPSWLRLVPTDFSDARAGTVKADEWCTLATVYIPLALVSLWGEGLHHQSAEEEAKLRTILDNTMYLVSAIHIACSSTMTESRVLAYRLPLMYYNLAQDLARCSSQGNYLP